MKTLKDLNNLIDEVENFEKEYYSMKEVLQLLNITDTTLYRYIHLGYFNKVKMFGRTWFRGSELKNYIHGEVLTHTVSK
jgi:predicted DNA-binding transcriptional regulator AlpA